MDAMVIKFKGISPGKVLEHELKLKGIKKRPFAKGQNILPQTLNEIIKGRRRITPSLSLKLDQALGFEEGSLLLLQSYYEIKLEQDKRPKQKPDLSKIRPILFWDTDINKIDWEKQYQAVIRRIFERGNDQEKELIYNFYGEDKILMVTGKSSISDNYLHLTHHLKAK